MNLIIKPHLLYYPLDSFTVESNLLWFLGICLDRRPSISFTKCEQTLLQQKTTKKIFHCIIFKLNLVRTSPDACLRKKYVLTIPSLSNETKCLIIRGSFEDVQELIKKTNSKCKCIFMHFPYFQICLQKQADGDRININRCKVHHHALLVLRLQKGNNLKSNLYSKLNLPIHKCDAMTKLCSTQMIKII